MGKIFNQSGESKVAVALQLDSFQKCFHSRAKEIKELLKEIDKLQLQIAGLTE